MESAHSEADHFIGNILPLCQMMAPAPYGSLAAAAFHIHLFLDTVGPYPTLHPTLFGSDDWWHSGDSALGTEMLCVHSMISEHVALLCCRYFGHSHCGSGKERPVLLQGRHCPALGLREVRLPGGHC